MQPVASMTSSLLGVGSGVLLGACVPQENPAQIASATGSIEDRTGTLHAVESGVVFVNATDGRSHVALSSWSSPSCDIPGWIDEGAGTWAFVEFEQDANTVGYDNAQLYVGLDAEGTLDGWLYAEPDAEDTDDGARGTVTFSVEGVHLGQASFAVSDCGTATGFFTSGL
jgi:hypothetical protein